MGRTGDADPLAAATDAVNDGEFDEVIVSTLPKHVSKWLHLDLPHKVAHATGLPYRARDRPRGEGFRIVGRRGPRGTHARAGDRAQLRGVRREADRSARSQDSLDAGGPYLCTVHAQEQVPLDDEAESGEEPA